MILRGILLVLSLFISAPLYGAVGRGTETTSSCSSCSGDTFAANQDSGSSLMMAVDVAGYHFAATTVTGITYAGQALTLVNAFTPSGGSNSTIDTWRRLNPATGSNNVIVTLSGNAHMVSAARPFTGVDQTTPFGSAVTSEGDTSQSAGITIPANGLGYDAGVQRLGGVCTGVTVTGGQTERYDVCNTGGDANSVGGYGSTNANAGSATHSYTLTAGGGYAGMQAIPMNAAAATARIKVIIVE